ncbi:hypothetical protein AADZ91_00805 [Colwelliaceae bacterium 6441]
MTKFKSHSIRLALINNRGKGGQFYFVSFFLILFLAEIPSVYGEVLSCLDHSGNTIYTDNRSHCATNESPSTKNIQQKNTLTKASDKCGKVVKNKHKVDYCTPRREYYKTESHWTIFLERTLVDTDKEYADKALNKLEKNLNEIVAKLPPNAARQLKKLTIYLMKGEKSGVDEGGMSYIRPGEPSNYHYLDPRWQHAIVVYSAKTLMYLDEMWTKKALMHELAHAWHISNWPQRYPPIYNAYLNAKNKGLYRNIDDYKGRKIATAYALKNQMEYFADLSAMYFVGGNYFPFDAKTLNKYDATGTKMVSSLWF